MCGVDHMGWLLSKQVSVCPHCPACSNVNCTLVGSSETSQLDGE